MAKLIDINVFMASVKVKAYKKAAQGWIEIDISSIYLFYLTKNLCIK